MKDDNEKNLDYDERIRFHNEIINSTNGSVYKNNNSINVVNDKNKKREENKISNTSDKEDIKKELNNKNTEENNSESSGATNFIVKFIMLIIKVAFFLFLGYVVLIALAFGICILIFSSI